MTDDLSTSRQYYSHGSDSPKLADYKVYGREAIVSGLLKRICTLCPVYLGSILDKALGEELDTEYAHVLFEYLNPSCRRVILEKPAAKQQSEATLVKTWCNLNSTSFNTEIPCATGRLDILCHSSKRAIEAKFSCDWKAALGQILAYTATDFSGYKPCLLLFGDYDKVTVDVCSKFGVEVIWQTLVRLESIAEVQTDSEYLDSLAQLTMDTAKALSFSSVAAKLLKTDLDKRRKPKVSLSEFNDIVFGVIIKLNLELTRSSYNFRV